MKRNRFTLEYWTDDGWYVGRLREIPAVMVLRARQVDRAGRAPLRGKLRRGLGSFDLEAFRGRPHARTLRD